MELWASRSRPSLATNERGILSRVTSHCRGAAAAQGSKVTCEQPVEEAKKELCIYTPITKACTHTYAQPITEHTIF